MKDQLILHCGSEDATIGDLARLPAPKKRGVLHTPIPHIDILQMAEESLARQGFSVIRRRIGLSPQDDSMFATLMLERTLGDKSARIAAGVRNNHTKRFGGGFVLGEKVFVCDNLGFFASIMALHKHTPSILEELPKRIDNAVSQIPRFLEDRESQIARLQERALTDKEANDLMIRAVRAKAASVSTMPTVIREWYEPSFKEFKPRNAWSLYNAFTFAAKKRFEGRAWGVNEAATSTMKLGKLFDPLTASLN